MSNASTTISSVLDSKSTTPEKNAQNILLWESMVIQMLNLPHAA